MFDMNNFRYFFQLKKSSVHAAIHVLDYWIAPWINALLSGSYHIDTSLHDIRLTIFALHDVQHTKMRYFSVQEVNMPYSKGTISVVNKLQMEGSKAVRTILIGNY